MKALRKYKKLCDYFKGFNSPAERYSIDNLDSKKQFRELREIIYSTKLPDFEYLSLLEKYSNWHAIVYQMDNLKIEIYNSHAKYMAEIALNILQGNKNTLDATGAKEI